MPFMISEALRIMRASGFGITVLTLTSLITFLTSENPFFAALRTSSKSLMSFSSFHEIPFKIDCRIQSNFLEITKDSEKAMMDEEQYVCV